MTTAHIDAGVGVIQLYINGQKERFGFRPKDEQCSQIKSFDRKESVKELEKPYSLIEFVENLQTREDIKVYNQRNAKRNIQHKNFSGVWEERDRSNSAYGARKCRHQRLHQVTMTEPKVWIVSLRTRNSSPCHEVCGSYPFLHWHIG